MGRTDCLLPCACTDAPLAQRASRLTETVGQKVEVPAAPGLPPAKAVAREPAAGVKPRRERHAFFTWYGVLYWRAHESQSVIRAD
jgi:hypothetical protein